MMNTQSAKRAVKRLHDPPVAHMARIALVVSEVLLLATNQFLVDGMAPVRLDGHDNCLVHLVAHNSSPDCLLLRHGVHLMPNSRSLNIVLKRARSLLTLTNSR